MTPSSNYYAPEASWKRLGRLLIAIAIVIFVATTGWSIYLQRSTGKITITTFSGDAVISISQNDTEAKIIGVGSTTIRLKPGTYQVVASNADSSGTAYMSVEAQETSSVKVQKATTPVVPSPENITMDGIGSLLDRGITQEQAQQLQILFFAYKQDAQQVTINGSSITRESRTPDTDEPFRLSFNGTIDDADYQATIAYRDLDNVRLTIYDTTGKQLFDKDSTPY